MDNIIANALPIAGLLLLAIVFRALYEKTKCKKLCLILDLVVHVALLAFMLRIDAELDEVLLVFLFTLAVAVA